MILLKWLDGRSGKTVQLPDDSGCVEVVVDANEKVTITVTKESGIVIVHRGQVNIYDYTKGKVIQPGRES